MLFLYAALAIIFGGLALLVSNGIRIYSERIGRLQNKQMSDTNERASKADERAGKANVEAGNANERAGKLEVQAESFKADAEKSRAAIASAQAEVAKANAASHEAVSKVADAEARIAEANRAAAEANRIAESERLARIQLEIRLAPRTLTNDQTTRLIASLTPFRNTRAEVVLFGDSFEVQTIGKEIIQCLQKAGWVPLPKMALGGGGNTSGIPIGVKADSDPHTKEAAATLITGLQSMGISTGLWDFDQMPIPGAFMGDPTSGTPAPIKIFIGAKP